MSANPPTIVKAIEIVPAISNRVFARCLTRQLPSRQFVQAGD